jgi:flavin reductase (DIM6/NTAB) family NADH-FMN oxidoreductase RutF
MKNTSCSQSAAMSDESEFNRLVAQLDYPMFVVTTARDEERAGCLVGFASQVSIHPPRFLACLSTKNFTFRVALRAKVLVVHPVPKGAEELAELFGGETGDDTDKFARWPWRPGPAGAPVLEGVDGWFAGRILSRHDLGDHCGFLLEPIQSQAGDDDPTLGFQETKPISPGHEP